MGLKPVLVPGSTRRCWFFVASASGFRSSLYSYFGRFGLKISANISEQRSSTHICCTCSFLSSALTNCRDASVCVPKIETPRPHDYRALGVFPNQTTAASSSSEQPASGGQEWMNSAQHPRGCLQAGSKHSSEGDRLRKSSGWEAKRFSLKGAGPDDVI